MTPAGSFVICLLCFVLFMVLQFPLLASLSAVGLVLSFYGIVSDEIR
jgi:hypothetical protein